MFTGLAAYTQAGVTLNGFGKPVQQPVLLVSANYFDLLGVRAAAGRVFRADEDRKQGGNTVIVLSYTLAQRLFGSAAAADWSQGGSKRYLVRGGRGGAGKFQGHSYPWSFRRSLAAA